jgi:hypothetical protein
VGKKVEVVPDEAAAVRTIFARYLELGSVRALADDLARQGIRSKARQLSSGRTIGGGAFGVGALQFPGSRRKLTCSDRAANSQRCRDLGSTCLRHGRERLDLHGVAKVGQTFDQAFFLLVGGTAIEMIVPSLSMW